MKKTEYTQEFLDQVLKEATAPNAVVRQVAIKNNMSLNKIYGMVRAWRNKNEPEKVPTQKKNLSVVDNEIGRLKTRIYELTEENNRLTSLCNDLRDSLTTAEIVLGKNVIKMNKAS